MTHPLKSSSDIDHNIINQKWSKWNLRVGSNRRRVSLEALKFLPSSQLVHQLVRLRRGETRRQIVMVYQSLTPSSRNSSRRGLRRSSKSKDYWSVNVVSLFSRRATARKLPKTNCSSSTFLFSTIYGAKILFSEAVSEKFICYIWPSVPAKQWRQSLEKKCARRIALWKPTSTIL